MPAWEPGFVADAGGPAQWSCWAWRPALQIHLAGVVLIIAAAVLVIWRRPRCSWWPIGLAMGLAIASVLPYLLGGHLDAPTAERTGYQHFWRSIPAALMSLSGLLWQLEFKGGYGDLAASLGPRMRMYQAVMVVPVALFIISAVAGVICAWRERKSTVRGQMTPLMLVVALVLLIPAGFSALGTRTSPTYLPVWYPLPFMLIGWFVARAGRSAVRSRSAIVVRRTWQIGLFVVMLVQMTFFAEQLRYIRAEGGVPNSILDRAYGPLANEIAGVAQTCTAGEVWMQYAGSSPIMDEACAFLFRQQEWPSAGGRVLIRFDSWPGAGTTVQRLPVDVDVPADAFLIHPWRGPQQMGGGVPQIPAEDAAGATRAEQRPLRR